MLSAVQVEHICLSLCACVCACGIVLLKKRARDGCGYN